MHWNIHRWKCRNQFNVQALGGINTQWHSNPDTQTTLQWSHRRDLPTCQCDCPGISRALSSWEQHVVLPVPFFWCPLPGGLKALPLEWHGIHKQFLLSLISKAVLKVPTWSLESKALLWCCFSAKLHCAFVLCNWYPLCWQREGWHFLWFHLSGVLCISHL